MSASQILTDLTLVDLAVLVAVVLSVATALRRRAGLLGAVGAALGTGVLGWLVAAGVVVWGPSPWADVVRGSELIRLLPPPGAVVDQARHLVATLITP